MDPSDVMVPADVPDELIDTYVENYLNATAGTGPAHAATNRPVLSGAGPCAGQPFHINSRIFNIW